MNYLIKLILKCISYYKITINDVSFFFLDNCGFSILFHFEFLCLVILKTCIEIQQLYFNYSYLKDLNIHNSYQM